MKINADLVIRLCNDKKYKPREICKVLGVCHKTLCNWDRDNILKARRNEKDRRYYLASDIKEFIRVHCI